MQLNVRVDHYFHFTSAPTADQLGAIKAQLDRLETLVTNQFENINASLEAVNKNLDEVTDELHGAAKEIAALKDEIANASSGLTAEQAADVAARLGVVSDKVQAAANIFDPAVEPGDNPPVEPTP